MEDQSPTIVSIPLEEFEELQAERDCLESQLQAWIEAAQELQIKLKVESVKSLSLSSQLQEKLNLSLEEINQNTAKYNSLQQQLEHTVQELKLTKLQLHQTQEKLAYYQYIVAPKLD